MILMGFDKNNLVKKITLTGKINKKEAVEQAERKGWTNLVFLLTK